MSTSLSAFIAELGDTEISRRLGVPLRTVQSWRRRERTPRPQQAKALIDLAEGRLSFESVYLPDYDGQASQQEGPDEENPDADRIVPADEGA